MTNDEVGKYQYTSIEVISSKITAIISDNSSDHKKFHQQNLGSILHKINKIMIRRRRKIIEARQGSVRKYTLLYPLSSEVLVEIQDYCW